MGVARGSSVPSFDGIVRDRPLTRNDDRRGVEGVSIARSSLETRRTGSLKAGEGDSAGLGASEKDRGLGVVLFTCFDDLGVLLPSS